MNQNVVAIIQARMGSSRLPGKSLHLIEGYPLLWHVISRIKKCNHISKLIIATTTDPRDNAIEKFAQAETIKCFRGSEHNVLDRFYCCAKAHTADIIVRITADDPFKDPEIIDNAIRIFKKNNGTVDYVGNTHPPTYPLGLDVEVFSFKALEKAWKETTDVYDKEHVTQYMLRNLTSDGHSIHKKILRLLKKFIKIFLMKTPFF